MAVVKAVNQGFWVASSRLANEKIASISWKPKFSKVHDSQPLERILSQINPLQSNILVTADSRLSCLFAKYITLDNSQKRKKKARK
jgi:hypothetical protein